MPPRRRRWCFCYCRGSCWVSDNLSLGIRESTSSPSPRAPIVNSGFSRTMHLSGRAVCAFSLMPCLMKGFDMDSASDHQGPVTTYMASCGDDCSSFSANNARWFKIDASGYSGDDRQWGAGKLIQGSSSNSSSPILDHLTEKFYRWVLMDVDYTS